MNNVTSCSKAKQNDAFEEDEIFDDSTFLANFGDNSFKKTRFSESNINDSINKSALNVSALCCDEEISGYDKLTGRTWIYPTNYSVRDYQFNIIKSALLKNTLVSLPTGLGKTFIAAVIMYNFYRWYPLGKIVFTAPTRPLVAQQIEACYNIIAIPPNDTIEMTGHMQVNTRKTHWQSKRVFFATPQVIYNDIKAGICPADKIRCLVIDEAHRARGNYAYCQIVASLDDMGHKTYRMLALSATPGSKVDDVINVVKSLHIAHLELRTENCLDVAPYSHTRKINTIIIQLGDELTQLREHYVQILDGYARRLKQFNILPQHLGNLSKGRIVMLYKEFQNKDRGARHPQHNHIMKDFTVLISLYHGLELLVKHGSRVFLNFFDEHPEKSWIQSDDRLTALLERLRDDLGINPLSLDRSILPDGTIPEIPKNLCFGHPKFDKLKNIMMEHFISAKRKGQDTRAIVFCEYRESVNLVHCLLLQCRPLITPQMFVGQGASGKEGKTVVSQKQQLRVMRCFREGVCNALVATCVAEEGLDVGSVDLILCFDISTRSPIRLVQRCGRTGRERGGQVFLLVTEGREHQTLLECMRQRDGLNKKILQSKEVENKLYKANPRMMPHNFTPQCQKMFITVTKKIDPKDTNDKSKKGQKDLRSMLLGRVSTSNSSNKGIDSHNLITEEEFKHVFTEGIQEPSTLPQPTEYWAMSKDELKVINKTEEQKHVNFTAWLEWQRTLQKTVNIGHSKDTEILCAILQYSDAKRFEIPASTQNPTFNTQDLATQNVAISSPIKTKQPKKQKAPSIKSPAKKDGDIRALFSTATKSTKSYTKLINDLGVQNEGNIPTSLINLLVDLNLNNTSTAKTCYICKNLCDCILMQKMRKSKNKLKASANCFKELKLELPDIDLIDEIDANSLSSCKNILYDGDKNISDLVDNKNSHGNFDLQFDFDSHEEFKHLNEVQDIPSDKIDDNISTFKDNRHNCSNNFELELDLKSPITPAVSPKSKVEPNTGVDKKFDIGDIEDIFACSSPEEVTEKEIANMTNEQIKTKETLAYFGLNSIDDIFADDNSNDQYPQITSKPNLNCEEAIVATKKENVPTSEYPLSPSILSGRQNRNVSTSPILNSQVRKFQLSTRNAQPQSSTPINNVKKQLILDKPFSDNHIIAIPDEKANTSKSCLLPNSIADTSNKSMFTITQLVQMINKTDDKSIKKTNEKIKDIRSTKNVERSTSPILLSQAHRKKMSNKLNYSQKSKSSPLQKTESLIILDSDSDSNETTQIYDLEDDIKKGTSNKSINDSICNKRKFEAEHTDTITVSPYFNKRRKTESPDKNPLTLQEKVLAAITSKNLCEDVSNNQTNFSFTISQPIFSSQKENKNPQLQNKEPLSDEEKIFSPQSNIDALQRYRRESKLLNLRNKFDTIFKKSPVKLRSPKKRKILSSESDDDFVDKINDNRSPTTHTNNLNKARSTINHKVRKKKRKHNSFLDMEAELSDNGEGDSGDELSDDSVGSILDFICDDNVTHHEDMQALYLKSVRSPVKNGFKIPQLSKKFNNMDVFSQFIEEDAYEMDSFCVDSNIGLTQVNEVSELELAEIALENKKKAKKKPQNRQSPPPEDGDSPIIKRRHKNANRQLHSDSDDSS